MCGACVCLRFSYHLLDIISTGSKVELWAKATVQRVDSNSWTISGVKRQRYFVKASAHVTVQTFGVETDWHLVYWNHLYPTQYSSTLKFLRIYKRAEQYLSLIWRCILNVYPTLTKRVKMKQMSARAGSQARVAPFANPPQTVWYSDRPCIDIDGRKIRFSSEEKVRLQFKAFFLAVIGFSKRSNVEKMQYSYCFESVQ